MANEFETALSIPTPAGSLLPAWWVQTYGPAKMFHSTLDLKVPENRKLLLESINEDAEPARDRINTQLSMIGYTVSPAGKEVDGEIHEWVRVVLHLADGTNVAAGSFGLLKSIIVVEQLDRPAPWNPPLVKVLRSRGLGNGKSWYYLADPESPQQKKK